MTSLSLMAPTPPWITRTRTSSLLSFSSEAFTASTLPCTSALTIRFRFFISPAWIWLNRSSRDTLVTGALALAFSSALRCSTSSRASFSSATALNVAPAEGASLRPVISTGTLGPASVMRWPLSLTMARTRPTEVPAMMMSP